jgi:septal ring factor EnvC (AmiA/AmiB activator)
MLFQNFVSSGIMASPNERGKKKIPQKGPRKMKNLNHELEKAQKALKDGWARERALNKEREALRQRMDDLQEELKRSYERLWEAQGRILDLELRLAKMDPGAAAAAA